MNCTYNMDINENSSSIIHTPCSLALQLPFHIYNCGHYYAGINYFTERDGLDNYLLIYTISGTGSLKYLEKEYTIKAGQIFVISCNQYHLYKTVSEDLWEFKYAHFNGPMSKIYYDIINESAFSVVTPSNSKAIIDNLDKMLSCVVKDDFYVDAMLSACITNLLTAMLLNKNNPIQNKKHSEHNIVVKAAMTFIQNNYQTQIKLSNILDEIHLSKYHFLRLFKRYTGTSPYEYLINYRINKSKALLMTTTTSVEEIAYLVGFNNVNNFIRDFKKLSGMTPLKYKLYSY